ncbi:MAG TPA: hypothetical protein VK598_02895 [Nitrospiraceae bacterium]|nr:hypothetical protein [Nitrospiraceae bacterium]
MLVTEPAIQDIEMALVDRDAADVERLAEAAALASIRASLPALHKMCEAQEACRDTIALSNQIHDLVWLVKEKREQIIRCAIAPATLRTWLNGLTLQCGILEEANIEDSRWIECLLRVPIRMWLCNTEWHPEHAIEAFRAILSRFCGRRGNPKAKPDAALEHYLSLVIRSSAVTRFLQCTMFLALIHRILSGRDVKNSVMALLGKFAIHRRYMCFLTGGQRSAIYLGRQGLFGRRFSSDSAIRFASIETKYLDYDRIAPGNLYTSLRDFLMAATVDLVRTRGEHDEEGILHAFIRLLAKQAHDLSIFARRRARGMCVPRGVDWYFHSLYGENHFDGRPYWHQAITDANELLHHATERNLYVTLRDAILSSASSESEEEQVLQSVRKTHNTLERLPDSVRDQWCSTYYWNEDDLRSFLKK